MTNSPRVERCARCEGRRESDIHAMNIPQLKGMTHEFVPKKPDISIEVYQHDWIPGFAAYYANGRRRKDAKAHVVINLGSCLCAVANDTIPKSDVPYLIAESIMHEVIHALEEWADVEFSEDRIEAMLQAYQAKYTEGRIKTVWKAGKQQKEKP